MLRPGQVHVMLPDHDHTVISIYPENLKLVKYQKAPPAPESATPRHLVYEPRDRSYTSFHGAGGAVGFSTALENEEVSKAAWNDLNRAMSTGGQRRLQRIASAAAAAQAATPPRGTPLSSSRMPGVASAPMPRSFMRRLSFGGQRM